MMLKRHPIAAAAALALTAAAPAAAAELTVTVANVQPEGGRISVAVFPDAAADTFPERSAAQVRVRHAATAEAVTLALHDLPAGDYAAVAYQDTNRNGELDTNLTGAPSEPTGFSEGATGTMGPPDFAAAAVSLTSDGAATEIPLSE